MGFSLYFLLFSSDFHFILSFNGDFHPTVCILSLKGDFHSIHYHVRMSFTFVYCHFVLSGHTLRGERDHGAEQDPADPPGPAAVRGGGDEGAPQSLYRLSFKGDFLYIFLLFDSDFHFISQCVYCRLRAIFIVYIIM